MHNLEQNKYDAEDFEELNDEKFNLHEGVKGALNKRRVSHKPGGSSGPPPPGAVDDLFDEEPATEEKADNAFEQNKDTYKDVQQKIENFKDLETDKLTKENFDEYMKGPTIFMVSGDACKPCDRMNRILARLGPIFKNKLKTVKWNADSGDMRIKSKLPKKVREPEVVPAIYMLKNGNLKLARLDLQGEKPVFRWLKYLELDFAVAPTDKDYEDAQMMTIKYQPIHVFSFSGRFPPEIRKAYIDIAFERALKIYPSLVFRDPDLIMNEGISKKRFLDAVRRHPRAALDRSAAKIYYPHDLCMEIMETAAKEDPDFFVKVWSYEMDKKQSAIAPYRREAIKQLLAKYRVR